MEMGKMMRLFLGYLDGATQFAQSCGGGSASSDLPWDRNPDEDDRRFAYRCMMQMPPDDETHST